MQVRFPCTAHVWAGSRAGVRHSKTFIHRVQIFQYAPPNSASTVRIAITPRHQTLHPAPSPEHSGPLFWLTLAWSSLPSKKITCISCFASSVLKPLKAPLSHSLSRSLALVPPLPPSLSLSLPPALTLHLLLVLIRVALKRFRVLLHHFLNPLPCTPVIFSG